MLPSNVVFTSDGAQIRETAVGRFDLQIDQARFMLKLFKLHFFLQKSLSPCLKFSSLSPSSTSMSRSGSLSLSIPPSGSSMFEDEEPLDRILLALS